MGLLDKVNNLVETIKNAVSGGSSSNESSAHSSGGGTSSNAARSAAQAAAAKYQADGQKRTTSTKSSTNNVLVDSVKHTSTSSGRTYSGTGAKAQNPEKAEKKAAAQTAADIAQQRGQSRTNYLKTYKTEESNYQAPKYKSSEDLNGARANTYDPADRYIAQAEGARNSTVDYMTGAERKAAEKASKRPKNYLSEADFKQMDINDSYSPNWMNDKTWQQRETEGKDFSIPKWFQNVAGSVLNSVGGSFSSNAGIAYEAGNEGRIQQGTEAMNDAWRTYVQALYAQATSDNPSEFNANVESAMRNLKGFADAIGPGVFEQTVANAENAMAEYRKDPNNFDIEYWLNNGNSGTLPDLTTFEGASIATRDLAQSMFAQSQAQNEAAKAALGNTTAGNILTDVAINLAEQGIDAAVGFLGSMGAAPQIASKVYQSISLGNMALRVFGQTASQVRDEGGNFGQQTFEAGLAAGVEVLTEKMSGGIAKFYGKGDTDEIVEEIARRVTQSDFGRSVIRTIGGMTGEAVEEIISTVVDPVVRAVHDSEATDKYTTAEGRQEIATEAGYSALVAALAALAGSSATYINGSNAQANAALTQTDQIQAELESNGMSTKDARKVAPNVQKYQSEGFEGLSKSEQKTLTNPLIRSIYGIDIELDSATDTINKQTDGKRVKPAQVAAAEKTMSDRLTPEIFAEYKKFNDESQTRETVMAAADAFNNELFDAVEGDVILDQNNRPVGRVKTVNDYGITIQYNDGSTESAVFMGNNGLLDPNSNLAKVFNDGGGVVAQEDADIIIRNAEQERKAQIKAGEEMQDRGEKAQPQAAPQPPKADTPAPHKAPTPAKAQPTQQQEAPKQQAPTGPQFQNQDVFDNTKYKIDQDSNGKFVVYDANNNAVGGTYDTYAEAVELAAQLSQQNFTPQTQETQEAETPVQTQEESQPEATQEQEAPSEPEAPPSRSPLTDSAKEANTVTENNGAPSKAEQYFADNPKKTTYQTTYKEAGVKIKKNADGTYTVYMASPKKNGQGWTKAVSAIGTVNSISEANQLVVDEYSKKSAPKALTDSATGAPIESPQNASQNVSQEEGNSVLPNEQNASEVQNEELNSKPEAESSADLSILPKWEQETYDRIKDRIPTWRDDQLTPMGDDFDRQNYSDKLISAVNELIEQEQAKRKAEKNAREHAENQRLDRLEKVDADIFAALKENPNTDISVLEQEYRAAASDFGWDEAFTNERFQDLKDRAASASFLDYLEDHGYKVGSGQDVSELKSAWEKEYYGQKAEAESLPQNPLIQEKTAEETKEETAPTEGSKLPQNPLVQTEEKTKNPLKPTPEAISQASLDYNIIEGYDFEERQQALTELPLEQIVALYRYAQNLQNLPENYGQYPNASFGMAIEEAYHDALRKYQDENVEQMRQENLRNKGANKNPQKYSDYQTPVNEDSTGKPLTQGQANFFSKSTLRDALGRLIRFFHGTGNLGHTSYDFSYADDGRTLWLSNSKDVTSSYSGAVNEDGYLDGRTMGASNAPVYVNMENPFILDGQGSLWNQIEITDDVASVLEQLGYSFDRSEPLFYGDDGTGKYANTRELAAYAYAMGYDGIVIKNIIDYGPAEIEVNRYAPADILAVFSSNQVKDVKNENPTESEDYRYKERLSDDEELARLDGGIAASEFNPDRPITAEKAHRFSKTDRIERAQKWAKHFEIKDGTVGLYDRLIRYIVDHDSAVTDAQREEIFALLAESASIKMNEQEQRMSKANDSVELDTDEDANADATSKYSDPSRGFDFTPDESDAEDAYDWKKVSGYMAENNRDTALARKAVLEELFPEKEFRVSDDGGSIEEVYGHTTTKNPLSKEERSWWRKHGWEEINKKFKKNFFQVKNLIPAWLRNGTYNKNLTDLTEDGRMGNRLSVHSMQYNGLRYYYQVGEGMYRHILNSNIMNGVNEVISRHEKLAARLKERIENGYQLAETPNALTGISTEQALQGVQQLEKKLKAEEGWLEKVRSGKYTLGNFYSDRSGVVTQADIQTVLDSVKGEDKTFETFSLKSLGNAMSESAAKELIDSIYKEATDGLYSRGINGDSSTVQSGEQAAGIQLGQLDNGDSQWRSEETGRAPSSVTDRTTYDESPGRINGRDVLPRRNSRRSNAAESGTDGSVSGEQRTDGQTVGVGNDSANRRRDFRTRSERSAEELNNKLKIRGFRLGKSGGNGKRITARLDGKNTFLDGDVTPRIQGGGAVADIINKAFESLNIVVNGITGNIYNFHGEFDAPGGMFTPKSSGWYTNPVSGYYNATKGRVLLRNIDGSNHNDVVKTARHEAQHRINERIPNIDAFARKLLKDVGADYDQATTRIKYTYGFVMGMDNDRIADEVLSRIADGDGFGTGMITAEQAAQLYEALTTSSEWQSAIGTADDVRALFRGTSSQIFTDDTSLTNLGRNKAPTVIGQNAQQHTESPQEQRITNIAFNSFGTETQQADSARRKTDRQTAAQRGIDLGLTREENIQSLADSIRDALRDRNYGLAQQMLSYASEQDMRLRQDLDQYSGESFDALVNDTSYEEASAINGQNYDQYDLNSELGAEQASETETLNSMNGRGVDTTSAPIENFQNAEQASENAAMEDLSGTGVDTERTPIDYFQSQEQASESDLIREQSRNDLTGSEDTNFESPYEAEQRTEQEAMDSLYENMDGRKLTSPKRTANDYYGSAYARVQETQKKYKRNKSRSSFSIAELYYKTYGETNDSIRNFKRLQRLNSNVDSLLDGKMSYYDFNSFAKNMSSRQGIGQILNDDIQRELDTVVALEEAAQDKNASEQDVADFQYAAANVVSHIVARMDMVEKTERARARLDTAAKKHGAKGGRKNLVGTALDAWNRYQITGDNFWRMMDDWAGKGQGYSYAREHLKTIATRISEEAKLKGYFALEGVDRKSKEFKDFVDGTSMSNVDFDGHKISLMEGIKFVKTVDTLRMFASENGRPSWQRVAALGGFTFEGKNGKPIFVDIQGSYDNNAAARAAWVEQRYNQLKQEIANNKAASAYMSAVEEMYYEASKDAEKVHSRVNGYDRYMYGKGWYTDIHYAKKGDGSVDFRYSDRDATDVHDTASMQRRTKVAGGYAIINPMSRSVDAYISQISNYIAFEEFGQKLGVLSDSKSINGSYANTIRDAYGDQYAQWFDNYVKTMTLYKENKPKGGMNSALAKARQAMMSGTLIGSVSVPIKQVSSFFDTMGTLDPRAVAAVFVQNPLGRKQKGIKNYLMDSRNQSISDPDLAELFGDKGILRKIKDTRIGKLAMSATNMMDATAVSNVYRACVLDVEYNNPLGKGIYNNGKNFKDGLTPDGQFYVDAKFEEALLGSQPIFTPQARNELARTDNQFARMFSTFRTQQTQNYNRMLQTWNEYQAARKNDGNTKEAWKKFVQTMTGQMIASASLSALTAIANTVLHKHKRYKDDDDELDEEKFWKRFGLGAFESLMGNSLFVGDITKWAIDLYNSQNDPNWNWKYSTKESQYFDAIEGMHIPIPASGAIGTAIQALNSAINLYRDVDENGWSDQNKLSARYLAGNIATAFGVQLNNVYYALNAGYQWYMDAAQLVTGDKKYEKKYDDIFTQMVKVDYSQQNRLVNSILAGKTQKVADMFDDMGQDKFENAVYYGAFDQYKAGKIDKAEYIELLMNFAGKSYKEASNEVEKKSRLLESGISQYNGIDGRDGRKAFYDQYSGNFQSRDAYKQFFEDVKNGKAEGKHNTYYTQWYGQPQEVSANQSSIIDTMNRNIQAGNFSYDTAKLLWENYYGYSTSKYSAWKFVGK